MHHSLQFLTDSFHIAQVLCNEALSPKAIDCGQYSTFEHLFVSFRSGSNSLRILVVYRPPSRLHVDFISEFTTLLEEVALNWFALSYLPVTSMFTGTIQTIPLQSVFGTLSSLLDCRNM